MDNIAPDLMRKSVQAQSLIRVKLGLPVAMAALGLNAYSHQATWLSANVGFAVISTYIFYACATFWVTRHPGPLSWRAIALGTAVLDPVILSAWLFVEGESAILVLGFYLFTILGFGFRIGPSIMRLCQGVAIAGFTLVMIGSPFWREHPFFGASHLILLFVVPMYAGSLMRDLHEAKALAERESLAKSQLLANVSHELRTPLTGIMSAAQLLEAQPQSREDAADMARLIMTLGSALDVEISQLLDLSKISVKAPQAAPAPFKIRTVLDSVQAALQEQATAKGLTFSIDLDPAIESPVLGHAHEMTSVVMNLAGNAVKFTHAGQVAVQVKLQEKTRDAYRLCVTVKDTGIGIAEDHHEKLFEPFFRVDSGDRRQYAGTGLGTTIAREHVRNMGGELRLKSQLGAGSTFWFEVVLPVARTAAPQGVAGQLSIVSPKKVMVADDNILNLELLQQMLLKDAHVVSVARSGQEAIDHLASTDFDVVMLDFNMGDLDGLTVFQMYQFGRLNPAPTFFITADTSESTAAKLNKAGAAGVIYKPLTFQKLRSALLSVFPSDAHQSSDNVKRLPASNERAAARLASVPVEHVDPAILDTLREIKDHPSFIYMMIGDGMEDIRNLLQELRGAISSGDATQVANRAHALRGVALNIGAVRLGSQCERLMSLTTGELAISRIRLHDDLVLNIEAALVALDELRAPFADASVITS